MTCKGARSYFANCPQKETTLRSEAICEKPTGSVNCAPSSVRSASVTPRATAQEPQTYTGISKSLTFSTSSLSGGKPTPCTASIMPGLAREAASPKSAMQQSISALPAPVATRNGSVASVGSSVACVATYIKGLRLLASTALLSLHYLEPEGFAVVLGYPPGASPLLDQPRDGLPGGKVVRDHDQPVTRGEFLERLQGIPGRPRAYAPPNVQFRKRPLAFYFCRHVVPSSSLGVTQVSYSRV